MDQLTSGEPERLIISYPAISEWERAYQLPVGLAARSLDRLSKRVLGSRPWLLDASDRLCLVELRRFTSVLQQLENLSGTDILTLGLRCPNRMRRYERSLAHLLERAEAMGVVDQDVQVVLRLEEVYARVMGEVRSFYQGLS